MWLCQDEKVNNYGAYYRNESRASVQRREYRSGNLNLDIRETSSESSEEGTGRPLPRYRSYIFYTSLSAHCCLGIDLIYFILACQPIVA